MNRLSLIGLLIALVFTGCAPETPSDGLILDAIPGPDAGNPNQMLVWNDALYLQLNDMTFGSEIWKLDDSGLSRITDIEPLEGNAAPARFFVFKDELYFTALKEPYGRSCLYSMAMMTGWFATLVKAPAVLRLWVLPSSTAAFTSRPMMM